MFKFCTDIPEISGIYCIENLINNKKYIGRARNLHSRLIRHRWELNKNKHLNKSLQRAWNKYGEENFKLCAIELYPDALDKFLNLLEIYFIVYYDSFINNCGYNLTMGGEGTSGSIQSKETIEKRIEKLRNPTDETRKLMSSLNSGKNNPRYGVPVSEESRRKMGESRRGERNGMYGIRSPAYGTKHTEEWKRLMSNKLSGINNPQFGKKLPNASSLYFGVIKIKTCKIKIWHAGLKQHGKQVRIGSFKSELDAAHAYDKYVIENNLPNPLNFPDGIHPYWEL